MYQLHLVVKDPRGGRRCTIYQFWVQKSPPAPYVISSVTYLSVVDNTQNQEYDDLRITLCRVFFMGTTRPPNSHIVYRAFEIFEFLVNVLALRGYAAQVDRRQS